MFQTTFPFELPIGYLREGDSVPHRNGVMKLARAEDEILALGDPRIVHNPAQLVTIVLSRVVTKLGPLSGGAEITPKVIGQLYTADLAYLQDFYNQVNHGEHRVFEATCPKCHHEFEIKEALPPGGSRAILSTG